ncbi:hypothetical protein ROHU_017077 [Labeo rohita]|uniref:CARD domain-containing protein n=1 Tax=Labeo rohita TaxID=84645 RepID=A0A498NHT3_LABRO|nr:hypothetical protein ROHU_017077 [Labeo rohita]
MQSKNTGVIKLLDIILGKGEDVCRKFLDLLKEDDVNEFSPELRKWIKTVDTKDLKTEKDDKRRESGNRPVQETANMTRPSGTQVTCKEKGVIKLLDIILGKGEDVCRQFLDLLKEDDVNEFSPELREWTKTVDTKGTANMTGPSDTKVPHQTPDRDCEHRPIQDYQKFLKETYSKLIQKVKNIDPIIDDLDLHDESVANVRAKSTNQEKMRKLLDCVNCESIAKDLFNALWKHEKPLMNELLNN